MSALYSLWRLLQTQRKHRVVGVLLSSIYLQMAVFFFSSYMDQNNSEHNPDVLWYLVQVGEVSPLTRASWSGQIPLQSSIETWFLVPVQHPTSAETGQRTTVVSGATQRGEKGGNTY